MKSIKIFCASHGASGVWAFSPEMVRAYAPKHMLESSEGSSGEIWEANLTDLDGWLWSFSAIEAPLAPVVAGRY